MYVFSAGPSSEAPLLSVSPLPSALGGHSLNSEMLECPALIAVQLDWLHDYSSDSVSVESIGDDDPWQFLIYCVINPCFLLPPSGRPRGQAKRDR
ncbi:hypothetical protein KFK09_015611 [Dendrobium nobile]|uniref:Uncharacterized protein n=1 Tax=Dendrobium nobile TaxID=94219 RepID=A0A8T3B7C2_DENNO|nr:hypothetical protein KFK09_015611 [Dendrobium nobile]